MANLHGPTLLAAIALSAGLFVGCSSGPALRRSDPRLLRNGEKRIRDVRQITYGGRNSKGFWSYDGQWIAFQHVSARNPQSCSQIYLIRTDGTHPKRISSGKGSAVDAFLAPDDSSVLFSAAPEQKSCAENLEASADFRLTSHSPYRIYRAATNGKDAAPAEATGSAAFSARVRTCGDGSAVFTSNRDGDFELYVADVEDGALADVQRVTRAPGFDGDAAFSPDCSRITWRASRSSPEASGNDGILTTEIWVANADGSDARQVTQLGASSFAPTFTPDGNRILFSSNLRDPSGKQFDLYLVRVDGTELEQVTFAEGFDAFPMFSRDGRYLVWTSTRSARDPSKTGEMNLFIAEWVVQKGSGPAIQTIGRNETRVPAGAHPPPAAQRSSVLPAGASLGMIPGKAERGNAGDGGVPIASFRPESPAEKAGARVGDVLVAITAQDAAGHSIRHEVKNSLDLISVLRKLRPGQDVTLHLLRSGHPVQIPVVLGSQQIPR